MIPNDPNELDQITNMLKALGEPNRLRIFAALMTGDSCNCELQASLDLPANLLSHHLRVLSKTGLIHSRRDKLDGRWVYYAVDRDSAEYWRKWFDSFWDTTRMVKRPLCGPEGQTIPLVDNTNNQC